MENQNQGVPQTAPQAPAAIQKDIFDQVLEKIVLMQSSGGITLPNDYAAENAIKSAFLIISELKDKSQQLAINTCTRESISKALLKMVTEGLNPLKRQGSFIVYGNQLQWQREYAGNIALAKRFGLKEITGTAIFENDKFSFCVENGIRKVVKHEQTLESISSPNLLGAYAIVEMQSGRVFTEIMSMAQIQKSWMQGYAKGGYPAHKNFPDQMAIKTVINRACKLIINSSDDSNLSTDEFDERQTVDTVAEEVSSQIKSNANLEELTFDQPQNEASPNNIPEPPIKENLENIPSVFN